MQLKVLTLNLWNGGRLWDQAQAFLEKEQADILLLQEAYNGTNPAFESRFRTVSVLQEMFPEYSSNFAATYLDTRKNEGQIEDGQLILSRFPILHSVNIFTDIPYGEYDQDATTDFTRFPVNVQVAVIEVAGKPVTLLNVHGPVNYDGTADTDRRLRLRDVILQEIEGQPHAIVGGDFNVQPATETIRSLSRALTPLFAEGELTTTFNMRRKSHPGYATAAVDNLFVTSSLKIISRDCPAVDVSDHLPLVATLEL
ncbi:MAG TPA: endonuclease/exonuclease/phosphatase family protein [Patescibacteria group bacterium]